jgi:FkbM family methyltransferase
MNKKIFLDCGTNLCQGLEKIQSFHNMTPDWTIYSFEANPITYNLVKHENFPHVKFINKAVWVENTEKNLSIEKWPSKVLEQDGAKNLIQKNLSDQWIGGGSNIMGENFIFIHSDENSVQKNKIKIECIDLCEFIVKNFQKEDYIIVKLDVEGAEYPILEKMIEKNIIDYINIFYIEFHNKMLKRTYDEKFIRKVINDKQIKLIEWY